MIRHLLPLGLFLAMAALLWQPLGRAPTALPSPLVNRPVPDFALPALPDTTGTGTAEGATGTTTTDPQTTTTPPTGTTGQ